MHLLNKHTPIQSMTGFAAVFHDTETGRLQLELRSVNSRFLDLQLRMPDDLRLAEPALRELLTAGIARGKVECRISLQRAGGETRQPVIDRGLLAQLVTVAGQIAGAAPGAAHAPHQQRDAAGQQQPPDQLPHPRLRQPGVPDARTVVLRHADPAGRVLLIHSHRRAGKIGQLQARPPVCLVFHDTASRTQVRAHGEATVHAQDALSAQAWQGLAAHSRGLYQGADDFAVLRVVVGELDWLLLDPAGHRRAGLRWSAGGWQSSWLEP